MEKNKIWMIIIIILLVVMCVGLTFGFVVTLRQLQSYSAGRENTNRPGQGSSEPIDPKNLILISYPDALTNNLLDSDDGSEHVLKLNLSIGLNGKEKKEAEALQLLLTEKEVLIKDIVNRIIRNKTYEQLKATDGQDELANEILDRLRQEFNTNLISCILFEEIIHM